MLEGSLGDALEEILLAQQIQELGEPDHARTEGAAEERSMRVSWTTFALTASKLSRWNEVA